MGSAPIPIDSMITNTSASGVSHVDNSSHHYHYGNITINARDMSRYELKSLMIEIFENAR